MTWTEPLRCALCGHSEKRDLRTGLAHWRDAPAGMGYEHVDRCLDEVACRARIAAQGDTWPLVSVSRDQQEVGRP